MSTFFRLLFNLFPQTKPFVQYELRLVASDNLNENYTTIVIHVNDVNDNPPVFDRPTYETQITEEDDRNLPKRVLQVLKITSNNLCCPYIIAHISGRTLHC